MSICTLHMSKYHHGDLRSTLIAVATELLTTEGIHTLSLRKIAQKAGVSHNAPYMHFADKEAVLAAIATEGFRQLTDVVAVSVAPLSGSSTRQKLLAASKAYVNFAIQHPNHLQVMFHPYEMEKYPELLKASQQSLHHLSELVALGQRTGELASGNLHHMTKAIWTMVHGVAALSTAHKTSSLLAESASAEETVTTFMNHLFNGIAIDGEFSD
jgi:AcrR family transcriptional regulator